METKENEDKNVQNVLIVDDELDICYLLSGILKQRNFRPGFVNSLSDAEIALRNNPPAVMFLDNRLPDGHGIDFIPFVKKNYPDLHIIVISAHDSPTDRKRAIEGGAELFLGKPLNRDLINEAINSLMGKPFSHPQERKD